jgi:hypothetical protein
LVRRGPQLLSGMLLSSRAKAGTARHSDRGVRRASCTNPRRPRIPQLNLQNIRPASHSRRLPGTWPGVGLIGRRAPQPSLPDQPGRACIYNQVRHYGEKPIKPYCRMHGLVPCP